jgi:hypothetical protein
VHKGSTQTNKRSKLGFKSKGPKEPTVLWSSAPDCPVCHWTVSGAPGHTESNKPLSGFSRHTPLKITGLSGVPPDYPVCHRSNGYFAQRSTEKVPNTRNSARHRQSAESEAHRTVNSTCLVRHRTDRCHMRTKPPKVDQLLTLRVG